ncbi:hypothetical protein RIN66_21485 (plasmid) [Hafnia alvei]|uniref:hypothetical protein n=1 Tax=Hafnia alvei TaxID=569 RepID=UPI0028BDF5C6|nr:hypothetical protein [Hafnia alvei]WNN54695.1 hypothetical protein RIN66_21485 [Hafnia alvei]
MKAIKQVMRGLILMVALMSSALAVTITIGKGTGIVWEGLPYNETLSGPMAVETFHPVFGLLSVSSASSACQDSSMLQTIDGYLTYPLGSTGVGLIPRAVGAATYFRANGTEETLTGTIGLPDTKGIASTGENVSSISSRAWCLPPSMTQNNKFYNPSKTRTATLSGTWIMVANGNQKNAEVRVPAMYFGSYSSSGSGDRKVSILPSNITLRISSLDCSVNTPTTINFNSVGRNTQTGAELASISLPLNTTCGQPNDQINANINLQFRALTGIYEGVPSRLALTQGGGYITGEIDNGVTGSGLCNATTGLPFDNTQLKVGSITSAESSKSLTNQVTWRLCSGGSNLPSGKVDASAEMLVTFN